MTKADSRERAQHAGAGEPSVQSWRDIGSAGRLDFSLTMMFTTLSPCDICAALIYRRQFKRLIVGHTIGSPDTLDMLRQKGVEVEILRDSEGIALFEKYRQEKPDQHMEDAFGLAAVHQAAAGTI
jgi:creatinine deaminase